MSFLWYREFYLEVTKAIQFPIGMSLPWILTEFVIKTPPLKENIFFPIEIYNDAAMKALRTLNQQFLYDEIEAECNLSFGQLIFHLSEDIFQYFKTVASSVLINKTYEQKYFTIKPSRLQIYSTRYVSLLSQRHIQLLGRSIDLSKLLTEQLNSYFRRNVDYAIRRYESGNIMGIIELSQLLENARMTHYLLSDFLHLDSFEEILKEVNEDVGLGSFRGRIALHSFSELVSFLFPSCIFNEATQRFVLGSMMVVNEPERSKSPQAPPYFWYGRKYREAFERQIALTKNYFGVEHVNALVNVLNYTDIPLIVNEVIQEAENKLIYDFAPYARALNEALPPFKLPKLAYRAVGGYGSYDVKLKTTIAGYGPLKPKVFQMMREMGNALLFLRLLDHAQTRKQDAAFLITAPLFGIRSQLPAARNQPANIAATTLPDTPFIMPSPDAPTPVQTALRDTFASLSSSPLYAQKAKPEDAMIINDIMKASDEAHKIYSFEKERPSFVTGFLNRLSAALDRSVRKEWEGTPPTNAQPVDIENPRSIARLLSAFQFIFHKVPEPAPGSQIAPFPDLSIFGEGWMYCLCMFVHITGWRHRFELMDFSYHVMRLATLAPPEPHKEEKKKKGQGPTEQEKQEMICNEFVRVVRAVKQKNDEIFSFLASYFAPPKLVALTINSPTAEDLSAAPPATGSMNLLPRASISVAAAPSTIGAYAGHGPSGGFHQYQPSMSSFPTLSAAAFSSLAAESAAAPEAPVAPEAPAVPDARPSDDLTAAVGSDDVYAAHHNQQNSGEGYAAEQYSGGDQSYQQYAAQYDQAAAADPYQQPVSEEQSASEVASLGAANPPPPPPPPAGGAPPPPPPPPPAM